jgi:hypothetical protein
LSSSLSPPPPTVCHFIFPMFRYVF